MGDVIMRYGYFDDAACEYVITRPDTPTPWINYIGSGRYGGIVSNTGGGYSFYRDPRNKRITRYRYNSLPMDRPGRYIYIRDAQTGEYWNPGVAPTGVKLDNYCCRHGMGYTVLEGEYKGVAASVTYFVPDDRDFEIWLLKVSNKRGVVQNLQIFSYAEFCFWDAVKDQQNVDWVQQINQGRYSDGIITWHPHGTKDASFFATGARVKSFDTNLETFIGRYRSEANPIAVEQGACSNSISYRMNGVGAFCTEMRLKPGEKKEIVFILGYSEDKYNIRSKIEGYLKPAQAHAALLRLKQKWREFTGNLQVETPDHDMNRFLNVWNQYQCNTTFNWARYVSLYQLGLNRGMGIRDSAQDVLGVVHTIPDKVRERLISLLKCQYPDGRAYHLYYPLTGEGGQGDAPIKKFDWYSDDHLWLILAVTAYLKETGDFEFLNLEVEFNDKKTKATVWEHLDRALEFTMNHRGPHGIALAGRADWNDTLNLDTGKGIAESVFTSMLFCRAEFEMERLANYLGDKERESRYESMYLDMVRAIEKNCWDGEWYVRAFDDEGKPIGSKKNECGQIFINSQSWAVIGGVTDRKRAESCLEAVNKYLNTKYGIVCMYPAYRELDETKGGITTYPPGAKENGGIFLHTNPWVIIAETMLGNGNRAFEYYMQILPSRRNDDADRLEVEPYVYPQNILGKEHPQFGTGRNSWLTGTAAWSFVAATQFILGIYPYYDELIIDPCIPSHWNGFKVKRVFRGAAYNIEVRNPNHVNRGVKRILLNGREVGKIEIQPEGTTVDVVVELG